MDNDGHSHFTDRWLQDHSVHLIQLYAALPMTLSTHIREEFSFEKDVFLRHK